MSVRFSRPPGYNAVMFLWASFRQLTLLLLPPWLGNWRHCFLPPQFSPVFPIPFLKELTGKQCVVRLKWGMEYKGFLVSVDSYMNIHVSTWG